MPALEDFTVFFLSKYYSSSFGDLVSIINRVILEGVYVRQGVEVLSTVIKREIHTI